MGFNSAFKGLRQSLVLKKCSITVSTALLTPGIYCRTMHDYMFRP